VTGVQTCALPIFGGPEDEVASDAEDAPVDIEAPVAAGEQVDVARSEQVAPSEREETDA